ncbi:hypothetical protein DMUE_5233 [Dictyocoela muelleri]|nr:hypothetical protein DMUE_5233 [Dictyocoela muelleri]
MNNENKKIETVDAAEGLKKVTEKNVDLIKEAILTDKIATTKSKLNKQRPIYIPMNENSILNINIQQKPLLVFDIDGTLYERSYNFGRYWIDTLKLAFSKFNKKFVKEQFIEYSRLYSAGVKGYFIDKTMTYSEYKMFIDLVPFSIFKPNDELRKYLNSLNLEKWCFTNACETHAERVLKNLGLEDLFNVVVHCDYQNFIPIHKPMIDSYEFVSKVSGTNDIIFFDDMLINVENARKNGWLAYHVCKKSNIIEVVERSLKEYNEKNAK